MFLFFSTASKQKTLKLMLCSLSTLWSSRAEDLLQSSGNKEYGMRRKVLEEMCATSRGKTVLGTEELIPGHCRCA